MSNKNLKFDLDHSNHLNKSRIQNGYFDSQIVENEYGSSYKIVMDRLQDSSSIDRIQSGFIEASKIIDENSKIDSEEHIIDVSDFVILSSKGVFSSNQPSQKNSSSNLNQQILSPNDSEDLENNNRLNKWMKYLAMPDMPNTFLIKEFPKETQKKEFLESLVNNRVGLHKSLWAIRIFGLTKAISKWANETVRLYFYRNDEFGKISLPLTDISRLMDGTLLIVKTLKEWISHNFGTLHDSSTPINGNSLVPDTNCLSNKFSIVENSILHLIRKSGDLGLDSPELSRNLGYLCEILCENELFSHQKLLNRLISCGDLDPKNHNIKARILDEILRISSSGSGSPEEPKMFERVKNNNLSSQNINTSDTKVPICFLPSHHSLEDSHKTLTEGSNLLSIIGKKLPFFSSYVGLFNFTPVENIPQDLTDIPISSKFSNKNLFDQNWTSPMPDDLSDLKLLGTCFDEATKKTLFSLSRSTIFNFFSSKLFNKITKDYVVKQVKVGLENWKVVTKPGVSLLNTRQLATLFSLYETSKSYGKLIDILDWLINSRCPNDYIEDLSYKYILMMFDKVYLYSKLSFIQNSLMDCCLFENNAMGSIKFNFDSLTTLKRFRKMCLQRKLHLEIDFETVLLIEDRFSSWKSEIQKRVMLQSLNSLILKNISSLDLHKIFFDNFNSAVIDASDVSLGTNHINKPGYSISNKLYSYKIFENSLIDLHSSLKKKFIGDYDYNFGYGYTSFNSQNSSHKKSEKQPNNPNSISQSQYKDISSSKSHALIELFIKTSLNSIESNYQEPNQEKYLLYQISSSVYKYLNFTLNLCGVDILGDELKKVLSNFISLILSPTTSNLSIELIRARAYWISITLIGNGLYEIENLLDIIIEKISAYSGIKNKSSCWPQILTMVNTLRILFINFDYSQNTISDATKDVNVNRPWLLVEIHQIGFAWSIVNPELTNSISKKLVKILYSISLIFNNLLTFAQQSNKLSHHKKTQDHSFYNKFSTEINFSLTSLYNCIGAFHSMGCNYIEEFKFSQNNISDNKYFLADYLDGIKNCSKYESKYSGINKNILVSFGIYEFLLNSQNLDKVLKQRLIIPHLLLNQSITNNTKYEGMNVWTNEIKPSILSFSGSTLAEVWHRSRASIGYWGLEINNTTIDSYKLLTIKCANTINSLYNYILLHFGSNSASIEDLQLGENAFKSLEFSIEEIPNCKDSFKYVKSIICIDEKRVSDFLVNTRLTCDKNNFHRSSDLNLHSLENYASEYLSTKIATLIFGEILSIYCFLEVKLLKDISELKSNLINPKDLEIQINQLTEIHLNKCHNYLTQIVPSLIKLFDNRIKLKILVLVSARLFGFVNREQKFFKDHLGKTGLFESHPSNGDSHIDIPIQFKNFSIFSSDLVNESFLPQLQQIVQISSTGLLSIFETCFLSLRKEFCDPKIEKLVSSHTDSFDLEDVNSIGNEIILVIGKPDDPTNICSSNEASKLPLTNFDETIAKEFSFFLELFLGHLLIFSRSSAFYLNSPMYSLFSLDTYGATDYIKTDGSGTSVKNNTPGSKSQVKDSDKLIEEADSNAYSLNSQARNEFRFNKSSSEIMTFIIFRTLASLLDVMKSDPQANMIDHWLLIMLAISTGSNFEKLNFGVINDLAKQMVCSREVLVGCRNMEPKSDPEKITSVNLPLEEILLVKNLWSVLEGNKQNSNPFGGSLTSYFDSEESFSRHDSKINGVEHGLNFLLQIYFDIVGILSDFQTQLHRKKTFPLLRKIQLEDLPITNFDFHGYILKEIEKRSAFGSDTEFSSLKSSNLAYLDSIEARYKSRISKYISKILPFKSENHYLEMKKNRFSGDCGMKFSSLDPINPWFLVDCLDYYDESDIRMEHWLLPLSKFNAKKRRLDTEYCYFE
ncbi:hypothetical protein AYI68_g2133 [Smittium mucronatum]|uniref:Uncharacterized protein n=1 Tax=Smittium mucronatum TaxID=133383 RepID=A0A1R0H3H1_9FUNG|nr:hypothetical protein AYI68_g2133 [Smittium mucronatum]